MVTSGDIRQGDVVPSLVTVESCVDDIKRLSENEAGLACLYCAGFSLSTSSCDTISHVHLYTRVIFIWKHNYLGGGGGVNGSFRYQKDTFCFQSSFPQFNMGRKYPLFLPLVHDLGT